MACGGCATVRAAGLKALAAIAEGDQASVDAALDAMAKAEADAFAKKPVKAAATRLAATGLARLAAMRR